MEGNIQRHLANDYILLFWYLGKNVQTKGHLSKADILDKLHPQTSLRIAIRNTTPPEPAKRTLPIQRATLSEEQSPKRSDEICLT